jgi:Ulp1 family protease
MMLKPLWISVINHNNLHWQLLCIINPGKPNCVAMLMDSLVGIETITVSLVGNPEPTFPSNLSMVRDFAIAYVTEVALVALGSRMQFNLEMQACLVPMQDNDFDCGTFALLNLKNCVYRADELVNLSNSQQAPRIIDFRSWYSAETGIGFREYLFRRYEEFLANYSQPE